MFAIPGLGLLLLFIYIRPQEIIPAFQGVPFLYAFVALTLVGLALDVRLGIVKLQPTPLVTIGALFALWSIITVSITAPAAAMKEGILSLVSFFLFFAVSQGVQSFRALKGLGTFILMLSLVLAFVGVHQAFAPQGCVKQEDGVMSTIWIPDGRACETRQQCYESSLEQDMRYRCERIGLWGTTSFEGRVRYRGIMEDPNELALVISIALPFAFAGFQTRRTSGRLMLAIGAVAVIAFCTILTKSRSGQLAFMAVIGMYLFKRVGWGGVAAAGVLAAPVVLLGGRKDAAASASSLERLDCWQAALEMFRASPLYGAGKGQFTEHHYLTAHNSLMLSLGEQGVVGVFLWSAAVYLAFKTAIRIAAAELPPEGQVARIWAAAVLASLCGLLTSAMFLSFSDHNIFWLYLGIAAALNAAVRRHRPDWRIRFGWKDAALVAAIDVAMVSAIFVYTKVGYG